VHWECPESREWRSFFGRKKCIPSINSGRIWICKCSCCSLEVESQLIEEQVRASYVIFFSFILSSRANINRQGYIFLFYCLLHFILILIVMILVLFPERAEETIYWEGVFPSYEPWGNCYKLSLQKEFATGRYEER